MAKNFIMGKHCIIGNNVVLGDNVRLGHNVIIEDNVCIGNDVFIDNKAIIRKGVTLGSGSTIGANCIIGELPISLDKSVGMFLCRELPLRMGYKALIRSNTIIYGGSEIGDYFQTGHNVMIREKSIIGNHVSVGNYSDIQGSVKIAIMSDYTVMIEWSSFRRLTIMYGFFQVWSLQMIPPLHQKI